MNTKQQREQRSQRIAIVGAGFSGIAGAIKLKRAGFENFVIFEAGSGVGGTWWWNRYPGAEVDTPSLIYSYSFEPASWTRTHVRQAELQAYLAGVVERYGLSEHVRLNTKVVDAVWNEERQGYRLELASGASEDFDAVVSAVGFLNVPRYPDWAGLEDFEGPKFHTSRWEHEHDLADKRVAVVGTGSTAAQVVPALADQVGKVMLFQREPGWVVPKGGRDLSVRERIALHSHLVQRVIRSKVIYDRQRRQAGGKTFKVGTPQNAKVRDFAIAYIDKVFAGRPDLRQAVTPRYPYGGKRPVASDDFYPSLLRENVELIPRAVVSLTRDGIIDASGEEHKADVLVMATGFTPADFLSTLPVTGRGGQTLSAAWAGEPRAFLGMMMPGFPNFFMLYGPNTNGGALVTHVEAQADYVVAALRRMDRLGAAVIDVTPKALQRFYAWLDRRLSGTVWEVANNYYKSPTGKVVTEWPEGAITYTVMTRLWRASAWKFSGRRVRVTPASSSRTFPSGLIDAFRITLGTTTGNIYNPKADLLTAPAGPEPAVPTGGPAL